MSQSMPSSVQRRKLLDEIRTLADIAVFGTLSETYRTCGRAGCHCQQGGPKHGPHLNISYRGEKGRTTGYYVPQGAEQATAKEWPHGKSCPPRCRYLPSRAASHESRDGSPHREGKLRLHPNFPTAARPNLKI